MNDVVKSITFDYISGHELEMVRFFAGVRFGANDCHAGEQQWMVWRCSIVTASTSAVGCANTGTVANNVALIHTDFIYAIQKQLNSMQSLMKGNGH